MNRTSTTLRVVAATAALNVTFAIFQTISTAYTKIPAEMLAKRKARRSSLGSNPRQIRRYRCRPRKRKH